MAVKWVQSEISTEKRANAAKVMLEVPEIESFDDFKALVAELVKRFGEAVTPERVFNLLTDGGTRLATRIEDAVRNRLVDKDLSADEVKTASTSRLTAARRGRLASGDFKAFLLAHKEISASMDAEVTRIMAGSSAMADKLREAAG